MDILDILIAKKKSFTGETEKLVRQANEAMAKANQVSEKMDEAQEVLDAAQNSADVAAAASQTAQEVAENLESIKEDISAAVQDTVDESLSEQTERISNLESNTITNVAVTDNNTVAYKGKNIVTTKNNVETAIPTVKNYTTTGTNEDGSMTQKAITEELDKIKNNPGSGSGSGSNTNLGPENSGKIVIVGTDGTIKAGETSEDEIIAGLINSGNYDVTNAVGLEISYADREFKRIYDAANLAQGQDFDKYPMYGGRKRCIVDNDGRIVAWYGDSNYVEDGSLGQVMYYQPKFYYNRAIIESENSSLGKIIRKENIAISPEPQPGFKLHPLFKDANGNEIEYILAPAYESTYYDVSANTLVTNDAADINANEDYLVSAAGVKPISGVNKTFSVDTAEKMAKNIGEGWHITNMAFESANQMLQMVEYGQLNGQNAIEAGLVNIATTGAYNCASITGSTSSLGNTTGAASSTINEINGKYTEYSVAGKRAISYRGYENPWGNIYRFIGGINLYNDGSLNGGVASIANDYNYTPGINGNNYNSVGFQITDASDWISAMGYNTTTFDWVYLPIEAKNASSLIPIGDFVWTTKNFTGMHTIIIGGTWRQNDSCGLFYYGCDQNTTLSSVSVSARIMHVPVKNSQIYNANLAAWKQRMGA